MNNWKTYKNGNYTVRINTSDGTKIRETEEDKFIPEFAENMDIKICDRCSMNCPMCHEGSTPDGAIGDLDEAFVDTLKPYQEVALGGGNVLEHPGLIAFLQKLREKKVFANITLNQVHFEENQALIKDLVEKKLVYGIGVSLVDPSDKLISLLKEYPNAVLHVINGIVTKEQIEKLKNHGIKMLILGYKRLRRGEKLYKKGGDIIEERKQWMYDHLSEILPAFEVVSFDNLAIEQLDVKRFLSDDEWKEFYMGDDGGYTFYIDMVKKEFAKSSTAPFDKRYTLIDDVVEMFNVIRSKNEN